MGHKYRIRPGVTSYLEACQSHGLRHATQALHTGMTDTDLAARLSIEFPNLPAADIAELLSQGKNAVEGATQLQSQLLIVEQPQITTWGYDPSLIDDYSVHMVVFVPAPSSWWTRLLEATGQTLPPPRNILQSIAAINVLASTGAGNPYPPGYTGNAGLRDTIPAPALTNLSRIDSLIREAQRGMAPAWFQAAYDTAQEAGIPLSQWGRNFGVIITGVFSRLTQGGPNE